MLQSNTRLRGNVFSDRSRKSYHNYYCETKWGDARGYDMTVKSDVLGFEGTAKMLIAYIRSFMEQD